MGALNRTGKTIEETPVSPAQLGAIIDLIKAETISGKIAKDLFEIVLDRRRRPDARSSRARGMKQVTDTGAIEKAVDEIIAANPDQVDQGQSQADACRLVRRPGDEVDRWQGQSAGRAGSRQGQARHRRGIGPVYFVRTAGEQDLGKVHDLLVETWHAAYDRHYGAAKVDELIELLCRRPS